eukprot:scaffold147731_cov28-Tisochrysis_lutea.AAC.2
MKSSKLSSSRRAMACPRNDWGTRATMLRTESKLRPVPTLMVSSPRSCCNATRAASSWLRVAPAGS